MVCLRIRVHECTMIGKDKQFPPALALAQLDVWRPSVVLEETYTSVRQPGRDRLLKHGVKAVPLRLGLQVRHQHVSECDSWQPTQAG